MIVGIYFRDPDIVDDPLGKEKFKLAYFELMKEFELAGMQPVIVRGQDTYTGGLGFSRHWVRGETAEPASYHTGGAVKVDVLFNRGRLVHDPGIDAQIVNHPEVQRITEDKVASWSMASMFQPPTRIVDAPQDFASLKPEKTYVAKVPVSRAGLGVRIGMPDELRTLFVPGEYPLLVQDFIETSSGYPGIIAQRHDLRVFVAGGRIVGFAVRPRSPELHDEQARSWMLPIDTIPQELVDMTYDVDSNFKGVNRYYCADYFYGSDGRWYLIELNATPGMVPANRGELADALRIALVDYIKRVGLGGSADV